MSEPKILAGHRWQQFTDMFGGNKPEELTVRYLDDMEQCLTGLADGSTEINAYALRGNEDDIELSFPDSVARIDTQQEEVDAYLGK